MASLGEDRLLASSVTSSITLPIIHENYGLDDCCSLNSRASTHDGVFLLASMIHCFHTAHASPTVASLIDFGVQNLVSIT